MNDERIQAYIVAVVTHLDTAMIQTSDEWHASNERLVALWFAIPEDMRREHSARITEAIRAKAPRR